MLVAYHLNSGVRGVYMKQPVTEIESLHAGTRRAYVSPSLHCYGLVQDLTQAGTTGPSESNNPCNPVEILHKTNPSCRTSDLRVKTNIRFISTAPSGMALYIFEYKREYKPECGRGVYFGHMAQEVLQKFPSAVVTRADGYYAIDYCRLRQLLH